MTTLYGSWHGSGTRGRAVCTYTRTYNTDHTSAIFDIDIKVEFDQSITDSVNSWNIASPDFTDSSGSNLSISYGSGGGTKTIKSGISCTSADDVDIDVTVSGIEATGATITGSFTLPTGELAPSTDGAYSASSITATSFVTVGLAGDAGGSSRDDTQIEWNTAASDSGASYLNAGSYTNMSVTGLTRATLYYFRMRVHNTGYGWGPWGPWKTFTTLSTVPGAPSAGLAVSSITQISASVTGFAVADNGGSALTNWQRKYNTVASDTGAIYANSGSPSSVPDMTGLLPGTTYYVAVQAGNANGWGAWSAWIPFTTLPGVSVNVGGVWKNAQPYVNVGGVWKTAVRYVNVGGVWKQ